METEQCLRFYSDGLSLDASFYPPTDPSPNKPVIMTCSGFQGLKTIHPARFARAFTARGYTCFGFDYRGYGTSEGEPGTVDEFIRDIANAMIAPGDRNELHPRGEARSLYDRYPGPKTLHWIRGGGHTEWMLDEHPTFQALVEKIDEWLSGL